MPIFDQGYQRWTGQLSGHTWRWLAITRHGVAAQWKGWMVKGVFFASLFPVFVLWAFLALWGLLEQKSSLLTPFMGLLRGLPPEVLEGPKGYRDVYWTLAFNSFFSTELYFTMLLVLLVGPNLISQDLRFNAIPLYLSRPLRRIDYFLGKLGVIAFYVGLVSILPAVLAYIMGVSFSMDATVIRDTWHILVASLIYGCVVVLSAGTLVLAFSSLSKNARTVMAAWLGVWIVSSLMSSVLVNTVRRDWCPVVSYHADLLRISEALTDAPTARRKLAELLTSATQQMPRPGGLFGGTLQKGRRNQPPRPNIPPRALVIQPRPGEDIYGNSSYPWQWSAGVLTGLFVLSVWTLSSRVKSLDRLK